MISRQKLYNFRRECFFQAIGTVLIVSRNIAKKKNCQRIIIIWPFTVQAICAQDDVSIHEFALCTLVISLLVS